MAPRTFALVAAIVAAAWSAAPATAGSDFDRAVNQFQRDLCSDLKIGCREPARRPPSTRRMKAVKKAEEKPAPELKPPVPRQKPALAAKPEIPLPRPKPPVAGRVASLPVAPSPMPPALPKPAEERGPSACHVQLTQLGMRFTPAAQPAAAGACQIDEAVQLQQLGSIEFLDRPVLACNFALRLGQWLKESAAPIVIAQANSPLDRLATGPGFECRTRNGDASAKVSEHGYGNAVDITSFRLADGRVFEVKDAMAPSSPAYQALKGLRGSACGYFTTVLGPGANAAHAEHFHLDLGKHGKSDNYRICE